MYIKVRIIEDFRFDDKPLFMAEGLSRPDGSLRTTRLVTLSHGPSHPLATKHGYQKYTF